MKEFFGQIRHSRRRTNTGQTQTRRHQSTNYDQDANDQTQNQQQRLPAYRQAIFRICQLQLKICSKLLEIAPNKPLKRQPRTLKFWAGSTILRPFRSTDSQFRHLAIERLQGRLPKNLINYLHSQQ